MRRAGFGLDLGGTKILGVVLDDDTGSVLGSRRVSRPVEGPGIVTAMERLVVELGAVTDSTPRWLGIGAAGLVDSAGVLRFGPNLAGVVDLDLRARLGERFRIPIEVDNDVTCAALAEHLHGAARGVSDAVIVALGTGIGGGVIMDGQLRRGAHRMAGEIGHLLVDPVGPWCGCGQRGCWEQYASGTALGRQARAAVSAGKAQRLLQRVDGDLEALSGEHVTQACADGDPEALIILDVFARWVAVGLAGLVNILDPELIVIGGGLAELDDLLLDPVRSHLAGLSVGAEHRPVVPVVPASMGEHAAAIGAAMLAGQDLAHPR